jgi:hypothetical protein
MLVQFRPFPRKATRPYSPEATPSANTFANPVNCLRPEFRLLDRIINSIDDRQQRLLDSDFHRAGLGEASSQTSLAEWLQNFSSIRTKTGRHPGRHRRHSVAHPAQAAERAMPTHLMFPPPVVVLFASDPPRLWKRSADWRASPSNVWLPIVVLLLLSAISAIAAMEYPLCLTDVLNQF